MSTTHDGGKSLAHVCFTNVYDFCLFYQFLNFKFNIKVMYAAESDYKFKQLAKQFGREKRVVVKYHGDFKYIHIYDNRKEAKCIPWIR